MIIASDDRRIDKQLFLNEKELEDVIIRYPELLTDGKENIIFVDQQVIVENGIIDALMLTAEGVVVVVEVKLSSNSESRRKVATQILDYLLSVTSLTYYELDEATKGKLEDTVNELELANALPRVIDTNLRNGTIKLFIVLDDAPDELIKTVRFLNDNSQFDLSLVEVNKYEDEGTLLYSSTVFVQPSRYVRDEISEEKEQLLFNIQERWNSLYPESPMTGNKENYRQVLVDGWPSDLHYELLVKPKDDENYYLRLDNEMGKGNAKTLEVTNALKTFNKERIHEHRIKYELVSKDVDTSRLVLCIPIAEEECACSILNELIELTSSKVSECMNV